MISDSQVDKAIKYMAGTDEQYGMLKGQKLGLEHRMKGEKALQFLKAEGSSAAEREAKAIDSESYRKMVEEYENTCIDLEVIGAKRKRAELTIEVWRTCAANQRRGNI